MNTQQLFEYLHLHTVWGWPLDSFNSCDKSSETRPTLQSILSLDELYLLQLKLWTINTSDRRDYRNLWFFYLVGYFAKNNINIISIPVKWDIYQIKCANKDICVTTNNRLHKYASYRILKRNTTCNLFFLNHL